MALFKACRGKKENLPTELTDGYAYFCTDSGGFYIDCPDTSGALTRVHINKSDSELSSTSTNPIQNNAVYEAINNLREEILGGAW